MLIDATERMKGERREFKFSNSLYVYFHDLKRQVSLSNLKLRH